ncbi:MULTISPECIES: hypothetical protein [Streptomyces]|uniref:hypothetical protein n=1 Tax=Streptomyces TaxID=1883 RepID=UPI00226DBB9E|nr:MULTISPECIES: hypothetical protein [unclassified Streptomyces]MCY0937869.1 hypothetical protein [Streptomyces sp. H34-S4]MCY0944242.1 hypothetical protein [Streptomyces sp. H34-AA3]MCZ4086651.1 hypothetical protein [Streptomyces sp. H34-S5]
MKPGDAVTIHQLLGRIAYFHTLFIEPALTSNKQPGAGEACCNHKSTAGYRQPDVGTVLASTAWAVLDEIATTLGDHLRLCPDSDHRCCAACRITASGAAIAQAWTVTEHRSYGLPLPADPFVRACRTTAATRLALVFTQQHGASCGALAQAETPDADLLPDSDDLPLTGELLALWQDPLAATRSPVVSWLNHCTDLNDIHRVLQQGGTTK